MIHINRGKGQHEWLTPEQIAEKYPDLHAGLNRPVPYKEYGQKLKAIRQKRDYSIRELAKQLNMKASEICDIELGRVMPSQEIVDYYGTLKMRQEDQE